VHAGVCYVFNNPLSFTDPSGYQTKTEDLEQEGYQNSASDDQIDEILVTATAFNQAAQDRGNEISREMQNQRDREVSTRSAFWANPGTGTMNVMPAQHQACERKADCIAESNKELAKGEVEVVFLVASGGAFYLVKLTGKSVQHAAVIEKALNSKAGVYVVTSTMGGYVGQSLNMAARVANHFSESGKLTKIGAEKIEVKFFEMVGSTKTEREAFEQYVILNKFDGIENLINKVNPMGGRMGKFEEMIDNVIARYSLSK
jgi:hypothetical protein